jgi:hypothetical protein
MSHIRHIVVRSQRDDSRVRPGVVSLEPLLLFEYDPCWERRWKEAFQGLKVARQVYEAASDEGAELSIVAQIKSLLARREVEINRAFLSQFRTTDEYATWRLGILDLELRWLPRSSHRIAQGLPMTEIIRRFDAVRHYAAGLPLSNLVEPPPATRRIVSEILEQPPTPETIRLAFKLRHRGGDDALRSSTG